MTHGLKIGVLINSVLTSDEQLSTLVGSNVYPIIAEFDTPLPFITYTRMNIVPATVSKDGYVTDQIDFNIQISSETYAQGCEIADLVRALFEGKKITAEGVFSIRNIRVTSAAESWNENSYVQSLTFTCEAEDETETE